VSESLDGGVLWAMVRSTPVATSLVRETDGALLIANEAWMRLAGGASPAPSVHHFRALAAPVAQLIEQAFASDGGSTEAALAIDLAGQEGGRTGHFQASRLPAPNDDLWLMVITENAAASGSSAVGAGQIAGEAANLASGRLQQAFEKLVGVGVWTHVQGASEVTWSHGLWAITGLSPVEHLSREVAQSGIHPDDLAAWHAASLAQDGRDLLYRWTRPDGTLRWLRTRMGRIEVQGQAPVIFGAVQDVTDERATQRAFDKEQGFINDIAAHVPGAIYRAHMSVNGIATVSYVSASVKEVLGVNAADVLADQRQFFVNIIPEDLPSLLAMLKRTSGDLSTLRTAFRVDAPGRGRRWIQAEATTQRDTDGSTVWHGFITDVTDHLEAAKAMERQHRMLQAVQKSQATFIELEDKRKAFDGLLSSFLSVTESEFGFVGEVLFDVQDQPYVRMQALTDIAWDEATRKVVAESGERGVEFHSLKTLFGHALRTGETVISNEPLTDARSGGLPPGHPPLRSFMAVPIALSGRLVAMVGLANRLGGFNASDEAFLQPLLGTVRELVQASRSHAERQRARAQFQATSALLAEKSSALQATFDSMNQGLTMVDASGRVRFYNQRMLEMLQLQESQLADGPLHDDLVKFQAARGDFGGDLKLLSENARAYFRREIETPPEKYVRRTPTGQVIEVFTRMLPEGGFVRTYTDVTSYIDTHEALREERQRLQWVLEATRPGIWEVNLETRETNYSDRWADMLGYTVAELMPTTVETWERLVHPDDLPKAQRLFDMHMNGDSPYYECDLRMRHKNGYWMWVNDRGRVHRRDAEGRPLYMSGTLLDIHDRVAAQEEVHSLNASLERRVAERTAELERSLKDVETISYSIAHDLRAPLRSVNGFAAVIAEEEAERLSPEARRMFERIAHSSRNMGQMITDMLELLRVVRVELQTVPVDMNVLAQSVSDALMPGAPNALIGIKPLPKVKGDATLLRQVLANLMDNALKYSKHLEQPELVLGYDDRQRAFYLRDNGMGFDMARAGKLFGLFQRMHAHTQVPGTGVGLAIVSRIVERHGGRIWAEAAPGKGATFWWTLPRA
jgi:PAS domain S-box-containing protein